MKKIKLLIPLAATVAATVPAFTVTSCNNPEDTSKIITTGDTLTIYKHKLSSVPASRLITVDVESTSGDDVVIYNSNGEAKTSTTIPVGDDGYVNVPVGYYLPKPKSTSSNFNLTFKDTSTNGSTETVTGLKYNYVVDYSNDLKDGAYTPTIAAKDANYWTGKDVPATYTEDIIKNSNIFQDDARYTTAVNIKKAIDDGTTIKNGLASFKAYFNDINKKKSTDTGVHVHMNYEVKGNDNSEFTINLNGTDWKFTNFNVSFSLETQSSYKIIDGTGSVAGQYKAFKIEDQTQTADYKLDGRLSGKFTCKIGTGTEFEVDTATYDLGPINNYTDFESSVPQEWKAAVIFASGIISLTYDFTFGTTTPVLTIKSPYAKNAQ